MSEIRNDLQDAMITNLFFKTVNKETNGIWEQILSQNNS